MTDLRAEPLDEPRIVGTTNEGQPSGHTWRTHPLLLEHFHPMAADDVQILVHDGGPRVTDKAPELAWGTVIEQIGERLFAARLLSAPQRLETVRKGMVVKLVAHEVGPPLMVTDLYLKERARWVISPCKKCGFTELFDAPSTIQRVVFSHMPEDATIETFTSFCGMCGGVQLIRTREVAERGHTPSAIGPAKKWWQVWR